MMHTSKSVKPDTSVKNIGQMEDTKPDKKIHVNGLAVGQYSLQFCAEMSLPLLPLCITYYHYV